MNIGDTVELSNLREGDAGKLGKYRFVVTERYPDDRVSGSTVITFEDGSRQDHVWDRSDPKVKYIGKGKVKTVVTFEGQ